VTDKELSNILNDLTIIVDTREQRGEHVIAFCEKEGIPYRVEKLDSGDYSFVLPNYEHMYLDYIILIERKSGWDEIAQNFTKGRDRFAREFERVPEGSSIHMVIENATWTKMINESYRSRLPHKSFMANVFTWNARYNCPVWTCTRGQAPLIIYEILYYGLREKLKDLQHGIDK